MKKLLFSLLTLAAAATAVTGIAACSLGQTGGGDTAARNTKNISATESQTDGDMQAPDGQTADGEFEFLPPDSPMSNGEPMPLPLPPQGRIFAPHVRHPEILHDAPMAGSAKEGTDENAPKGRMPKRKDGRSGEKGDMVTPDGSIMPQVSDTDVKAGGDTCLDKNCPDGCPDSNRPDSQKEQNVQEKTATDESAAESEQDNSAEKPAPEKHGHGDKRTKEKKGNRRKHGSKEKDGNLH